MPTKHKMMRFKRGARSGYNYRSYCVVEKHKGNTGLRWEMADDEGEFYTAFRTLAEFRNAVDRWFRTRGN